MRLRAGATPLQEVASVPDCPLDCMTMGQIGMVLGLFGYPRRLIWSRGAAIDGIAGPDGPASAKPAERV